MQNFSCSAYRHSSAKNGKVKISFLLTLVIFAIVLVEMYTLNLIAWPESLKLVIFQARAKWIAPLAIILATLCWGKYGKSTLKPYNGYLKRYLLFTTISVLIIWMYSYIKYPLNGLITTYGLGSYYFYAFLAVPILYIFEKNGGIDKVMHYINIVTIIMYIVAIVDGLYFMKTGNLLFATISDISTRFGKIRLRPGAFAFLMVIYNFYNLYSLRPKERKHGFTSLIFIILEILSIFTTGQTRAALIIMGASIAFIVLLGDRTKKKKIVTLFAIFMVGVYVIASGALFNVVASFDSTGALGGSTIARVNAVSYYFGSFLKNPIFAIGFAGDVNYYNLVHGNSEIYYQGAFVNYDYSDVGFIGLLAQTGVFSLVIYVMPLIRIIRIAYKVNRKSTNKYSALLAAWACYLTLTSATLIVTSSGNVIAFPFLIAIFEYIYHKWKVENTILQN